MQDEFLTGADTDRAEARFAETKAAESTDAPQGTSRAEVLYPNDLPDEEQDQEEASLSGAPERYAFAPPDGMTLTPEIRAEIEPVFRELNLSDHGVKRLMPLAAQMWDRNLTSLESDHARQKSDWAKEAKGASDIGGQNWPQTERNLATVMQAGDASQTLRQLLNHSGLGNHPEFIRFFNRLAPKLSRAGSRPIPGDRSSARFPDAR